MLSKKMEQALNAQVNAEFWSAYLYLSMSNHFAAAGNQGFANWFSIQFQEEQAHATIFMKYVLSCGGKVTLAPIAGVKTEWKSPLEAFEDTLAHERKVTALIHDLCVLADEEKDFGTANMLKWFVDEQIEEEANAQELIDSLKMIKDNGFGLHMLDKELKARVYTTPAPLATSAEQLGFVLYERRGATMRPFFFMYKEGASFITTPPFVLSFTVSKDR